MKFSAKAVILASAWTLSAGLAQAQTSITVGSQLEPPHLDPTSAAAGAIDNVVYSNIFEGLTRFMADGSVVAGLAESWEISDDGLTYTFKLHDGVTFHDGTGMDAEDVKFSLDRARAEDSTNAQKPLFAGITDVTVIDPLTVQVTLSEPNGNFLFNMAWGDAVIVAPESIETITSNPIGTGAFKFADWVQGDRIEIVRNDDYWGTPAKLESATFKFINDPTAAFGAMMAEDIDAFIGFPAPENLPQFEADPRFTVLVGSTEGETILAINNKMPPMDNILVRQAITHAIDRQAIIDGAMFGYGTPIGTHFAPHNPAYVDLTGNSEYDPEKSKALLAEAGLADGFTTTLKLPPPSYARRGGEIICRPVARRWHRDRDHQPRMGAVAGRGVPWQGLRHDHCQPYRTYGHRHLWQPGLLLPVWHGRVPGDHDRAEFNHRSGRPQCSDGGRTAQYLGELRQRISVPVGSTWRCQGERGGNLDQPADPGD